MKDDDQKTLSKSQLDKKQRRNVGGRSGRIVFTPDQVQQIEKLAAIGMSDEQIAWVMGVGESTLQLKVRADQEKHASGKAKSDNVYVAMKRGRSKGDALLAQTAFDMATKDKNVSMVIFLAKTRLRWAEPAQDINVRNTVIFETQIGKDGVIRQQVMDADWDESNVVKLPKANGSKS